ncbi:hypothetical protein Tco_1531982 [Tanacetum coccineum]
MDLSDPVDTPMVDRLKLDEDLMGIPVDQTRFRGMAKPTKSTLKLSNVSFPVLEKEPLTGSFGIRKTTPCSHNSLCRCEIMRDVQDSRKKYVVSAQFLGVDIRHHFIREQVENRVVELYFVETNYQLADILTKALPRERFEFLLPRLGMKSLTPETLRRLQEGEDE